MSGTVTPLPEAATTPLGVLLDASEGTFCGRKASLCNCISTETVYTVASVIGLALLIIGIVGLIGHCAPTTAAGTGSPLLQKLNAAVTFVSMQIGTDPLILVSFPTAFGIALSVTGVVSILQNQHTQITV